MTKNTASGLHLEDEEKEDLHLSCEQFHLLKSLKTSFCGLELFGFESK
jgi:hypothetical protein